MNKMTLNQKLALLSEIAEKMEAEDIEIEDALSLYAQGVKLADDCRKQLTEAKQKIIELSINSKEDDN